MIKTFTGTTGQDFANFVQQHNLYHTDFTIDCYQHLFIVGLIKHDFQLSTDDITGDTSEGDKFWADFMYHMEVANLDIKPF